MGFNILDKNGQHIGWSADVFDNDSQLQFLPDDQPLPAIQTDISALKIIKINDIKQQAASMIDATDWQLQRAQERDALGIDADTPIAVYTQREAIRRASNRAELEIDILEDAYAISEYQLSVELQDYPAVHVLTHLQFLRRFTVQERANITAASEANAAINDYMSMLNLAKFVNIKDSDVILGVNLLEQATIIGKGRAAQILVGL